MKYELFIDERVEKKLARFPPDVVRSIDKAILALQDDPRSRGCRKIRVMKDCWRIVAREDYSILYRVSDEERRVEIYEITRRGKNTYVSSASS